MPISEIDRRNYEDRKRIADCENDLLRRAMEACGPDAKRYGIWNLVDRATGAIEMHFCCCRTGHPNWHPKSPLEQERLTESQHPGFEINGKRVFPFRYEVRFRAINVSRPRTPEQLAEARGRRIDKRMAALRRRAGESLFPEIFDADLAALDAKR